MKTHREDCRHLGRPGDQPARLGERVRRQPADPSRRGFRRRGHRESWVPGVHAGRRRQDRWRPETTPYHPYTPGRHQHRFLQADRDSYDAVRAYFYDVNSTKKQGAIAGGGENLKNLRHTYSDRQLALRAARAELNRLQRGAATLSYTLAKSRPDLTPELTYTLQGVKAVDEIIWYGGNVQHRLTADSGYTVSLELES